VREPFVLTGAGVKTGRHSDTQMVDIAPTLAALLGVGLPSLSQGRVRTDMLQLAPERQSAIVAASAKQQAQWLAAYNAATGQTITVAAGADPVTATQHAVAKARAARAASERLFRIAVSALAAVAMLAVIWFSRSPLLGWQAVGATLYLALFHAAYALGQGRTYSLSSVLSAKDVVDVCVLTAGFAIVAAIVVVLWRTGALRRGASEAARAVLDTTLLTVAVVSLPALVGYAVNGAVITWRLPNFPLMFVTFMSLLQMVGIGIFGTLFAAVAALRGARVSVGNARAANL
jgi:hypothetical protein